MAGMSYQFQPSKKPGGFIHFQVGENDVSFKCSEKYYKTRKETSEKTGTRGSIVLFSNKSKHGLRHKIRNTQHTFKQFITLTYPAKFPMDGATAKQHINNFTTRMRQEFPGIQYCWVFEAQTRGAPHFHIIIDTELPNENHQDKDGEYFYSEKWSKIWSKITGNAENKQHLRRGLRIDPIWRSDSKKLANYFAKYYTKNEQKEFTAGFTNIGRFWGTSKGFCEPRSEGVYRAEDLRWMLKLCFHYANLERDRKGLKRYRYSTEAGCSLWDFREILFGKVLPQMPASASVRLAMPYQGLSRPPTITS
ncbi:hypothetical protein [Mariprofundus sp. KV]|uniref:rolling circle replication-associated protein n=1 Tax=Mariprofundus sp. KV TaxID=2608715 RepID=UPI0015A1B3D9|nr:hypothetical protein [Mariprofundus sp. KV]NWF36287.1 hypothetical protein [Mariprofundus sp. KV]